MSLAAVVAAQLAADRVRERAAEVLGRGEYQRRLPEPVEPFQLDLPGLGVLGKLLTVLAWTGLAILLALLATWAVRRLGRRNRDTAIDGGEPAAGARAEIPLASAEALAAEARYGDAIHALLLETLRALSVAARLPASFTAREIVARVPLQADARGALAGLVSAVEVSWFGGAVPGEADYRACLERFHLFLESYRSSA